MKRKWIAGFIMTLFTVNVSFAAIIAGDCKVGGACTGYCENRGGAKNCHISSDYKKVSRTGVIVQGGVVVCQCVNQDPSETPTFDTCSYCENWCKLKNETANCTTKASGSSYEGNVNVTGSIGCACTK